MRPVDRIAIVEVNVGITARFGPDGLRPRSGATCQGGKGNTHHGEERAVSMHHASPHTLVRCYTRAGLTETLRRGGRDRAQGGSNGLRAAGGPWSAESLRRG